ncbi:MAG: FAD-containing oxidoreductase [Gemmatimonadales bacterium]|nr:MAG: FAD-containing oxidoreductase [Gemmatimonadales bacterium]
MERGSSELQRCDDLIIGTGQAGKPLAGALAAAGRRVVVVERGRVGGTCVVRGCTPSKTLAASARVAYLARRAADYGVMTGPVRVKMGTVRARKRAIVNDAIRGSRQGLEGHESLELICGEARFVSDRTVRIEAPGAPPRRVRADRIFLNTGARPRIPEVPGLEEAGFLDSTSIMELGEVPDHLVVLGGGVVGLEFAQMFRRFGADVTIVDKAPRLMSREDDDVSDGIVEILRDDGILVLLGVSATRVDRDAHGRVRVQLEGRAGSVSGSHILIAAGRVPNTEALNLEATGLGVDAEGFVPVNDRLETGAPGIWAMGDVAGSPPSTHMAYDDFRIVRENLLGEGGASTGGRVATYTVYLDPELGRVGLTAREATEAGHRIRVAALPMSRVARAVEMGETRGFMKAVVDADSNRILGASILGVNGGEVAAVVRVAMLGDLPCTALRDVPISHPALAESLNTLFGEFGD